MHDPRRVRRRSVSIAGFAALVAVLLSGSIATRSTAIGSAAPATVRMLQFNLCNSGIADCYTGRSVATAAAAVRADAPDVVSLNEICQGDVAEVSRAMADQAGQDRAGQDRGRVASAFRAAGDRRTGEGFLCRNGQPFGIGLVVRLPAASSGYASTSGIYPTQDPGDPEERAYLCIRGIGAFEACTTHLASNDSTVALAQCHYLLTTAVPAVRALDGDAPAVVGGDFNLGRGGPADVRTCVPPGYLHVDDSGVQQVIATSGFAMTSVSLVDMHRTTDHPGLLVTLTS